jgi:hypothetical protein
VAPLCWQGSKYGKYILQNVKNICLFVKIILPCIKLFFMKHTLLLPNRYKKIGWSILIPSFIIGVYFMISNNYEPTWLNGKMLSIFPIFPNDKHFSIVDVNFARTITGILFIVGGLLVGFSKEKNEDEFIEKLRLSSLQWAVLVNYILLIVTFLFVYDIAFLSVMVYNMFTILIIFIVRFNFILYRNSKFKANEK